MHIVVSVDIRDQAYVAGNEHLSILNFTSRCIVTLHSVEIIQLYEDMQLCTIEVDSVSETAILASIQLHGDHCRVPFLCSSSLQRRQAASIVFRNSLFRTYADPT
jgi:hypothetical protein